MFHSFKNVSYSKSNLLKVDYALNTDFSVDGEAVKVNILEKDQYLTVNFDPVDFSGYEEISFYFYNPAPVGQAEEMVEFSCGSASYRLKSTTGNKYQHCLVDCRGIGTASFIRFKALTDRVSFFFDVPGCRRAVPETLDDDILTSLSGHINLNYNVTTNLSSAAAAGATKLNFTGNSYISNTSLIIIDNSEVAELASSDGTLKAPITGNYPEGTSVKVMCPVVNETYALSTVSPYCGMTISDIRPAQKYTTVNVYGASKKKKYLGDVIVSVNIECEFAKKLLELTRQFENKYGNGFSFLLDGELVEANFVSETYNGPKKNSTEFEYSVTPQPVYISGRTPIDNITINLENL